MIDTQTLDFMEWQQNSDQEHLVFFFQRESKTVDDAARQTGAVRRTEKQEHSKTCEKLTSQVSVLPAQYLQQLSNTIVVFCLIYEPVEQHSRAGNAGVKSTLNRHFIKVLTCRKYC